MKRIRIHIIFSFVDEPSDSDKQTSIGFFSCIFEVFYKTLLATLWVTILFVNILDLKAEFEVI